MGRRGRRSGCLCEWAGEVNEGCEQCGCKDECAVWGQDGWDCVAYGGVYYVGFVYGMVSETGDIVRVYDLGSDLMTMCIITILRCLADIDDFSCSRCSSFLADGALFWRNRSPHPYPQDCLYARLNDGQRQRTV